MATLLKSAGVYHLKMILLLRYEAPVINQSTTWERYPLYKVQNSSKKAFATIPFVNAARLHF